MEKEVKFIVTEDGSHSLYLPHLNETYHSSHGALTESKHVFIEAGLDFFASEWPGRPVSILEIGFGTGLNALLAYEYAEEKQLDIHFTSLEPFPLTPELYTQLNYGDLMQPGAGDRLLNLHKAEWNAEVRISGHFVLEKRQEKLEDFTSEKKFDLIFFDAFAPSKQAELWEHSVLAKTVGYMATQAVLVTYCAKGQFKRDLASLDLKVATLPGPPGKKEMVRATTN